MENSGSSSRKIIVTADTTFVTAPLHPDGHVDYSAAIHESAFRMVTPENNAVTSYIKVLGPTKLPVEFRDALCKSVGIPPLNEEGKYFLSLEDLDPRYKYQIPSKWLELSEPERLDQEQTFRILWSEHEASCRAPWKKEDFPHFAALLATNEQPFQLFTEGAKREYFFSPYLCRETQFNLVPVEILDITRQLTMRVMMRLNAGDVASPWEDVLTCLRWGRLCCRGVSYNEYLVGINVEEMAWNCALDFIFHSRLNAQQASRCLVDFLAIPPRKPIACYWHEWARFSMLYTLQNYALQECVTPPSCRMPYEKELQDDLVMDKQYQQTFYMLAANANIDWNEAMRCCNAWSNRVVEAFRLADYCTKAQALWDLQGEIYNQAKSAMEYVLQHGVDGDPGLQAHRLVDLLVFGYSPHWVTSLDFEYRSLTWDRLCATAFAVAGFYSNHGCYPMTLEDLVTTYLSELPLDPYCGRLLRYRPDENGYVLSGIGPFGVDNDDEPTFDASHQHDQFNYDEEDCELIDDLTVRMPREYPYYGQRKLDF